MDGVPLGAEARVAVGTQVDDIDARDAGTVDKDVVIGHGTALCVDKVIACCTVPHKVYKAASILRRVVLAGEGGIA